MFRPEVNFIMLDEDRIEKLDDVSSQIQYGIQNAPSTFLNYFEEYLDNLVVFLADELKN